MTEGDTQIKDVLKSFYEQNGKRVGVIAVLSIGLILLQNIIFPNVIGKYVSGIQTYKKNLINLVVLIGLILAGSYVQGILESKFFPDLKEHIRTTLLDKLFKSNQMRYEEIGSSSFISILNNFVSLVVNFCEMLKYVIVPNVLVVIFILAYLFFVHPLLGFSLALIMALYAFVVLKTINNCNETNVQKLKMSNRLESEIDNLISNMLNINISGQKEAELHKLKRLERINSQLMSDYLQCNKSFHSVLLCVSYSVYLVIPAVSSMLFTRGQMTHETVISIFLLTIFLHNALSHLTYSIQPTANMFDEIQNMDNNLNLNYFNHRSNDTATGELDRQLCPNTTTQSQSQSPGPYIIEIKNISFSYGAISGVSAISDISGLSAANSLDAGNATVFKDFSLSIRPNTIYGIYGKNGLGKTTLIKLLMGFERPHKGKINVFGTDLNLIKLECLRKIFRLVPQKHNLFNTSILANITYGNDELTKEHVHEFLQTNNINCFDNIGLESSVGLRGEKISGGQRQIILVLRALLSDAQIIILDEPSSQLDQNTAETLIRLLQVMKKKKTILIITHDQKLDKVIDEKIVIKKPETFVSS